MLPNVRNQILGYAAIAAVASVCAAAMLLFVESSLSAFGGVILILAFILIGFVRTEWLLLVILLTGIFYTPLEKLSFRMAGILVIPMDAIFLLSMVMMLLKTKWGRKPVKGDLRLEQGLSTTKIVSGVFLLIIFAATFIGLFRNHYWQTVFAEAKLGLYYGALPLILWALGSRKLRPETLMLFLVFFSTLGSLYDIYARIFDIYTVSAYSGGVEGAVAIADTQFGDIIRDYGWVSTFHYQVFSALICLCFILQGRRPIPRLGLLALLVVNVVANLLTVTRGFTFALLIGGLAVIVCSSLVDYSQRMRWGRLVGRFTIGVLLLVTVFVGLGRIVPQANASFGRLWGVMDRSYAGKGDVANMEYRLQSIKTGFNNALEHPLGMGFGTGSPSSSVSVTERLMLSLMNHNSIGYMLYKFGFPGAVAVLVIFALLCFRLFGLVRTGQAAAKRMSTCVLSCLLAIFGMSFTSGNFLFSICSVLPFVVIMIATGFYYVGRNTCRVNP